MGDEGEFGDDSRLGAASDGNLKPSPGLAVRGRHKAERDGATQRWREAAGGDLADDRARRIEYLGALPGGGTLDKQTNADAGEVACEFAEDAVRPREVAGLAAALADGEAEAGLGGRDAL